MERRIEIALPEWEALPDIGLYMDQVVTLTDRVLLPAGRDCALTRSMINNYVKFGLISRPQAKKYSREQLAQLMMIGMLKPALSLEHIGRLLAVLCAGGVREGYARFARETQAACEAIARGCEGGLPQDAGDAAVRMGVAAAVCTIAAGRLLEDALPK